MPAYTMEKQRPGESDADYEKRCQAHLESVLKAENDLKAARGMFDRKMGRKSKP